MEVKEGLALVVGSALAASCAGGCLGFAGDGGLEVVDLAAEVALEAEAQGGLEAALAAFIPEEAIGQQEAQRLRLELPVHEQELAGLGVAGAVAVAAAVGVLFGGGRP